MSMHGLGGTHLQFIGVSTEDFADGLGFSDIVGQCAGSVRVDVADRVGTCGRVLQCRPHGSRCSFS